MHHRLHSEILDSKWLIIALSSKIYGTWSLGVLIVTRRRLAKATFRMFFKMTMSCKISEYGAVLHIQNVKNKNNASINKLALSTYTCMCFRNTQSRGQLQESSQCRPDRSWWWRCGRRLWQLSLRTKPWAGQTLICCLIIFPNLCQLYDDKLSSFLDWYGQWLDWGPLWH